MAIFPQKSAGNRSQLGEAKFFIQTQRGLVALDHRVELENPKSQIFSFPKTMFYQLFADMVPSPIRMDGVTGIADMSATTDIVGVQDIAADDFPALLFAGQASKRLFRKKHLPPAFR